MLRAEKIIRQEALKSQVENEENVFLISFSGVNVPDITELRRKLKEQDAEYVVVKNRIFKRVIAETDLAGLDAYLQGPTALIIARGDPVEPSKTIMEFKKDHPDVFFKAGCVEGKIVDAATMQELSTLPTREELLAKLLFLLQSPARRLVTALNAPIQHVVTALKAVSDKR